MKYKIKCYSCKVKQSLVTKEEPKFCPNCGGELISVSVVESKSYKTAREKINRLRELKPLLEDAEEKYLQILVEYEDELQLLGSYESRGYVATEELAPFKRRNRCVKPFNERKKEYRAARRAARKAEKEPNNG